MRYTNGRVYFTLLYFTYFAATDHGEFIILVAGKRRSLLMAENNDEVYDRKPQRYAEDNVTQW